MKKLRSIFSLLCGFICLFVALSAWKQDAENERFAALASTQVLADLKQNIHSPLPNTKPQPQPQPQPAGQTAGYAGVLEIESANISLPILRHLTQRNLRISPCIFEIDAQSPLVIAGHNYKSHFGALSSVSIGDKVTFTDMNGTVFSYTVAKQETLSPESVSQMFDTQWDLTLFTCTYSGNARLTLRCTLDT